VVKTWHHIGGVLRQRCIASVAACALLLACPAVCLGQEAPLPIAYWSFDEFEGPVAPDVSGNDNDAFIRAGLQVSGVSGGALQFDQGTQARVRHSDTLELTGKLTLEAWVKLDSRAMSGFPTVIREDGCYALRFDGSRLGMLLWFNGQPVRLSSRTATWETDHWYHLVGAWDGQRLRLFIDGTEDASLPLEQAGAVDVTLSDCYIGPGDGHGQLAGAIDEARIYDRALTEEQIAAAHEAGRLSLQKRGEVSMNPKPVGERAEEFRKPQSEIKMVQDGFLWIDAEDFHDYGGWLIDTDFVHLMGSPYLIAAGIGKPVKDATLTVALPRAGRWRVWVRARNWLPEYSPGRFEVLFDGESVGKVLGAAAADGWLWEPAGEVEREAGEVRIALHDLTGYYGRCDALVLTQDMQYTPPSDLKRMERERARLTGLSLEPKFVGEFDVVVVGAGAAGSCAALAAARHGAKTALIDDRPVPGGNASRELGVPISGASCCHPNARESGIIEELAGIKQRYGFPKMSGPIQRAVDAEPSLSMFLNTRVVGVEMADDDTIAVAKGVDTLTGEHSLFRGKVFIDCTGDGWVGFYAGAQYRFGREARSEFDESLAPEAPDAITMSGCIMGQCVGYRAEDMGQPVKYTPPPWAPKFDSPEKFGRNPANFRSGQWWLEHPGAINDIQDAEHARDELIRITFGYWDYIKNVWPEREKAATYRLSFVPINEAKRETRRLVGDYMLNQNDVQDARVFDDRISYGGWPLDVHHPEGIYSGSEGPFDFDAHVPIYTIPYRILYSSNIDNLLMAGRDVSVTHVALGTVRVQGTLATLGQASGTAAAMCVRYGITPRGVYEDHITELQQTLLRDGLHIPELRNQDPDDLARRATVTASSEMRYEEFGRDQVQPKDTHELLTSRATMMPRGEEERVGWVELLLASERAEPVELTLHLREAQESADFSSREDLATATATVPPGKSWVRFQFDQEVGTPYLWVWLPQTEGVSWYLMESAPLGACRAYGGGQDGEWTLSKGQYYAIATDPPTKIEADYKAQNVLSGLTRPVGHETNMWASDPTEPMPQWVELDFAEPVAANTVCLFFDTDLNTRMRSRSGLSKCVRDYEVQALVEGEWRTLARVEDNYQRRREHTFEAVRSSKLRLLVSSTNGAKSARVFEIRLYNE